MKIQCDVCDKDEASVFCVADEAALCAACDHRVHHANKLAGKHQRFSLHHPSPNQTPLCDICQERRAFLFCQQDRAILCRECDISIHKANEHTQKHTRFFLTGVKLSSNSVLYSSPISAAESESSVLKNSVNSDAVPNMESTAAQSIGVPAPESCDKSNSQLMMNSSAPISEYLIDMLPGWHVEDFLDSAAPPFGVFKNAGNDGLPLWDSDFDAKMRVIPTERMGIWVPQAPPNPNPLHQTPNKSVDFISFGGSNGIKDQSKDYGTNNMMKSYRKGNEDNSFAVPQISPPSTALKRSRTLW